MGFKILLLMKYRLCLLFLPIMLLVACSSDVPDYAPSNALVMEAQKHFSSRDYAALEALFSEDFANGESSDSRKKKFEALNNVLGKSKSVAVLDSSLESNPGEVARITYTLSSTNDNINSRNRFLVVKEGGTHKIAMMDIQAVKE